ncbi:hypothetical protein [Limosilactobacillus sp.]|jgi:Na+/melibiose symporter-like transporter|uniref:hypothetical protein n=1 Tax=Limosilactobacillus sp. TaxID=2773925 RepID=UPI0025C62A10|nr:hypothetical protein [Limosilactobacillus sp.]MCH3921906.1 hypothetical protein [Limosilactobacillus sp.]MCH3928677.1 hypothetical protein [Limosilactobacillus sp.]
MKKVRLIEAIIFVVGWNSIFLAGADFPPPKGFAWLVITTIVLAILQDWYLKSLFSWINKPHALLDNEILFGIAGLLVALCFAFPQLAHWPGYEYLWLWILIIVLVAVTYGAVFFLVNRWLAKRYLKGGNEGKHRNRP